MNDPDRIEAIRSIAGILAGAYLRLRLPPSLAAPVDCAETKSESCDARLTP